MATYTDHVGDIFRATMAFTFNNGQVQEVDIHYQVAVAGGGDSRAGVLSYVDTGATVYLLSGLPATATYYGSKLSTIKALAPWSPKVSYNGTAGGSAANELPTQTRGLVSWRTALSGRAYRGRSYLPTTTVPNSSALGRPIPALLSSWGGWASYMGAPFTSGGTTWVPGIYHRVPTAGISSTFDQFTSSIVSSFFATQRRSGDYGRVNPPPF